MEKFVIEGGVQLNGEVTPAGNKNAAVCTDCHGAHEITTAADPKSPIFKFNVPATCGKCHGPVEHEFQQSIHGQVFATVRYLLRRRVALRASAQLA